MSNSLELYQVNRKIDELIESGVDQETGEIGDDVFEALEKLEQEKGEIVKSLALKFKELSGFLDAVEKEYKRLAELKKFINAQTEGIKGYLARNIKDKVRTEQFEISFRKSESLEVDDDIDFDTLMITDPELVRVKYEVDKSKAKAIFKQTGLLPLGMRIKQTNNILIK